MTVFSTNVSDRLDVLTKLKYGTYYFESLQEVSVMVHTASIYANSKTINERKQEFNETVLFRLELRSTVVPAFIADMVLEDISISLTNEAEALIEEWREENAEAIARFGLLIRPRIMRDFEKEEILVLNNLRMEDLVNLIEQPEILNQRLELAKAINSQHSVGSIRDSVTAYLQEEPNDYDLSSPKQDPNKPE